MTNPDAVSTERQVNSFKAHGCYKVSKIKEKYSDCQDSYSLNTEMSRVAISDGATQSFYSGLWSQILCSLYCSWPKLISHNQWTEWNDVARAQWIEEVNIKLGELKDSGKPSWIECLNGIKLKKDAFATFIGISLEDSYLHGICIGDSCAMLVKQSPIDPDSEGCQEDHSITRIFPGLWRHSFDSRTTGLSSYNSESNHLPEFFHIPVPVGKEDYRILLMTDALAHYVIDMEHKGMSIISSLMSLSSQEEFAQYIDECRKTGLANDDATLVIVEITDIENSSELEKEQGGIDHTTSSTTHDLQVREELVDAVKETSIRHSLQPSVNPLPLALPSSSLKSLENRSTDSDVHIEHESSPLSQAHISTDAPKHQLQSENEIPDQDIVGYQSPLDKTDAKVLDSKLDNNKRPSSQSINLPPLPGKKKWISQLGSRRTVTKTFRRIYRRIERYLRPQW
jgi:hypothetical protein